MKINFTKTFLILTLLIFISNQCTKPILPSKKYKSQKDPEPYAWIVELQGPKKNSLITSSSFTDKIVMAVFKVEPNLLYIQLKNQSKDSLHILWNECTVNIGKENLKIMHSGQTFEKRFKPLEYEIILPGEIAKYYIAPKLRVDWNEKSKKWRSFPIFEKGYKLLEKKKFTFNLVAHQQGKALDYPFEFKIQKVFPISFNLPESQIFEEPSKSSNTISRQPIIPKDSAVSALPKIKESDITPDSIEGSLQNSDLKSKEESKIEKETTPKPDPRPKPIKRTKSQKGISSLLDKLEKNKILYDDEPEEEPEDSVLNVENIEVIEEQDSLDIGENIPLFSDEIPKNKNKKVDKDKIQEGLIRQGIGSM